MTKKIGLPKITHIHGWDYPESRTMWDTYAPGWRHKDGEKQGVNKGYFITCEQVEEVLEALKVMSECYDTEMHVEIGMEPCEDCQENLKKAIRILEGE